MSDQHSRVDEAAPPLQAQAASNNHEESYDPIAHFSSHMLERSDSLIYAIVGVFFLLGSLFALGYSIWDFLASILIPKLDPSLVAQFIFLMVRQPPSSTLFPYATRLDPLAGNALHPLLTARH